MNVVIKQFEQGNETDQALTINHLPDTCSLCQQAGALQFLSGSLNLMTNKQIAVLELIVQCPRVECKRLAIAYYAPNSSRTAYKYMRSKPANLKPHEFSEKIQALSPEFVDISNQAREAESSNLDKISGVGYRKALEFLIKDYLINILPEEEEEIKKKQLGQCIEDYVTDAKVKQVAKRAAWLGNDETHYVKKWTDQDITDLKNLITLSTYWIESELLTKEMVEEKMPEGKPTS